MLFVCPGCAHFTHEWPTVAEGEQILNDDDLSIVAKDANGTLLADGGNVILTKDLKAGTTTIKKGTKVSSISVGDFGNGHDVSCTIKGSRGFLLKGQFLKRASA